MKIALTGKMRSGKDTIAEYAIEEYGFARFAFGDGIRKVCKMLYPDQVAEGKKPRRLYQFTGQTLRQSDENVWVNYCFNQIEMIKDMFSTRLKENETGIPFSPIITDLRQPNEYNRCKQENYVIIKVHTDDEIRLQRMNAKGDNFTMEDLSHETEQHIDKFEYDYIIVNNGKLEDALRQFDKIMEDMYERYY